MASKNKSEMQLARRTCVNLLNRMEQDGSYSNLLVANSAHTNDLSPVAKKLCVSLYYSILERKLTLDAVIQKYSSRPIKKMDLTVHNILRMGICQLAFFHTEDFLVVNECVALTKSMGFASASGMVNGILRSFLREDKKIAYPKDPIKNLSVRYSVEPWLAKQIAEEYGMKTAEALFQSSVSEAPLYVKHNPLKCSEAEFLEALEPFQPESAKLPFAYKIKGGNIFETEAFQKGWFHVQDLSSQICAYVLGAQDNEWVYDLCAAPGGKSFSIAEHMHGSGKVVSFDLHTHRAILIDKGANRLGLGNIQAIPMDASKYQNSFPKADRVLCDVPCSGYGVIRHKPEIKYKGQHECDDLPQLQMQILENGASYVRSGGILVYSTCTLSRRENDNVITTFLEQHPDFELVPFLKEWGAPFGIEGKMTLSPDILDTDGFFIAKLRKK